MEQSENSPASAARVLIIDDDIYASEMYALSLRAAGHQVEIIGDGLTGYQQMRLLNYDVVLLDLILPQLQGDIVLQNWRADHPKGSKPFIFIMTNYEQTSLAKSTLIGQADGYLVKAAITPGKLREIIAKAMGVC